MSRNYTIISNKHIEELKTIVGASNVIIEKDDLEKYSLDESLSIEPHAPEIAVKPVNTGMIADILRFANNNNIPVTPRGAGTGLSGGCIPIFGGILLSLERMNRIKNIDEHNFIAVIEPAVTLSQLDEALIPHNLYYPVHLGEMSASIGGNIATNAGGMNAVKYGVTRHHILGIKAVLPTGEVINSGGAYVKCSTGYDLTQLLTGSEGTLAVITEIILKLMPRPVSREILLVPFHNLQDAVDTVPELLRLRTVPMGIEFLEWDSIQIAQKHFNIEVPFSKHEAFLMIIMEGDSSENIIEYFAQLEKICLQHRAIEFLVPEDVHAKKRLIELREKIPAALRKSGLSVLIDAVVPRSEIAKFVKRIKEISLQFNIQIITFGHAGDGNVHLHPMLNDLEKHEWNQKLPMLMKSIYEECRRFGGMISGEHGIGSEKKEFLPITIDVETLNLMKRIKLAFDPNNILNPGKIFDL